MIVVVFFIPCFIIFLGLFRIARYYKKCRNYYGVKAVVLRNVVEYVQDGDRAPFRYYSPVVMFTDKDGVEQTFVSSEDNSDRPMYDAGRTVRLLVNPDDPSRFIFDSWFDGYVISSIWLLIGVVLLIVLGS